MYRIRMVGFASLGAAMLGVPAYAQTLPIEVDRNAPGARPYVGVAGNGVPVVNIAPPNRPGGTSVNPFIQYNVGPSGVVVNNSGQGSQTRIAGWVPGNLQLGNQHAGTIVQQVTAHNPSQLLGMHEIAGHRAALVIVNPAGITCAGCGTINTDRFTLSTGRALYGPDGSLSGFNVDRGHIAIDGHGLSSPQAQVDLLARSIAINAALWTEHLNAVSGANQVGYAELDVTAQTATGTAPQFAIDASALGSMFGGAIRLVGTEKGVGFHLGGTLVASTGNIVLENNGDVRIEEAARLRAGGDVVARGTSIVNDGVIGAGVDADGKVTRAGSVDLKAEERIQSSGSILAGSDASLSARTLALQNGTLIAQGTARLDATGDIDHRNANLEARAVEIATEATLDNTGGFLRAVDTLDVEADKVINRDTRNGTRGMEAATLRIVADAIDNTGGALRGGAGLAVAGATFDNTGGEVTADGMVELEVDATDNTDGRIASNTVVSVQGSRLDGKGTVQSGQDIRIELADSFHHTGTLAAGRNLELRADGDIVNTGDIVAGRTLDLEGGQSIHNAGLVDGGAVRMEADTALTNVGRIFGDSVALGAGERIVNEKHPGTGQGGVIASRDGDIDLGAPEIVNREHALIYSARDLNVGGELDGAGNAVGKADRLINASAIIDVARDASLGAAEVSNQNSHFSTTRVDGGRHEALTYRLKGSTEDIPADSVVFYHVNNGNSGSGDDPGYLGSDDHIALVLPSERYPFADFGPPFHWSRNAWGRQGIGTYRAGGVGGSNAFRPVGLAYYQKTYEIFADRELDEAFIYQPDDAIWQKFGVDRPDTAPPKPVSCSEGAARDCQTQYERDAAAYDAWRTANLERYEALNVQITAFNQDFNARLVKEFYIQRTTTQREDEAVASTDPARILVGRDATFDGQLTNDKSQVLVGGKLITASPVRNLDHNATRIDTVTGTRQWTRIKSSRFGGDHRVYDAYPFDPVVIRTPTKLAVARTEEGLGKVDHAGSAPTPTLRELPTNLGGTIRQVTPTLSIPDNALFQIDATPGARYLIETDPRYTDRQTAMSSDHMLRQLGQDPSHVLKRLGDGFYEARLVADAVMLATGQRFVGDYSDNAAQYAALMEAGVAHAKAFQLGIGTELSAAQMAQLTSDMVWLVEKSVTLPDGTTQQVLVPQVYLMSRVGELKADGTLIAANTVSIQTGGDVTNTGTISGRKLAQVEVANIDNTGGTLHGGTLALKATRDIDNVAGTLRGGTIIAEAGRDINLTSTTATGSSATGSITQLAGIATVQADNATFVAGRDLDVTAASIEIKGDLGMRAARDFKLGTVTVEQTERGAIDAKSNYSVSRSAQVGTRIRAGGNAMLVAGQDIDATAALVSADGALAVGAGRDIRIAAGKASASARDEHHTKSSGLLSSKSLHTIDASARTEALGSTFSGNTVTMVAERDLRVAGSTVAGTGDVTLVAGRKGEITAAETESSSYGFRQEKKTGFGAAGGGISFGKRDQKDTVNDRATGQAASLIGSTEGSVIMRAGSKLTVKGTHLIAAQDIEGVSADVSIEAAQSRQHRDEAHEVKQTGITLSVGGGAIGSAIAAGQKVSSASKSQDGRASALWGMAAARDLYDAGAAAGDAIKSLADGKGPQGSAVSVSLGTSKSKSTLTQDSITHSGSSIRAGGAATFVATGVDADANRTGGRLDVIGSEVASARTTLIATGKVNVESATDSHTQRSSNKSSSASLGASMGAGWGVSLSGSTSKGKGDVTGTTQVNSRVTGSESLTIVSGEDINIQGAMVGGGRVKLQAANLNLASRQDLETSKARQHSASGGLSWSQAGGLTGSFSASMGKGDGSYANVGEQSGIFAGDGGFDIDVKGNTDIQGAIIASTATRDKNTLRTGTLSWGDIENKSDYSATSMGITGGFTFGPKVEDEKSGQTAGKNTGGAGPMIPQHESGGQRGVAQAGIAEGTITITDQDGQKQDVATLNRDTSNTNTTVGKGPDLTNLLNKQADMMAAAQAAGEAIARTVGDIAASKLNDANLALQKANKAYGNDPSEANRAAIDAAKTDIANWSEGGNYRATLHAAGGAMVAGLGGGNAVAGGLGAGASSLAAGRLAELGSSVAKGVDTGNPNLDEAIGNLAANLAAGGLGAAVGGGSGAAAGATVDRFNRQLHPDERELAKKIAAGSDGKYTEQQVADALRLASNSKLGEMVTTGMVVDGVENPEGIYDAGAMFAVPSRDGRTLVQVLPSGIDPGLADYIRTMTGNSGSPYVWSDASLGKSGGTVERSPQNPFITAPNGCLTAECAAGLGQQGRGWLPDYATANTGALSGAAGPAVNLHDGTRYLSGGVIYTNPSAVKFSPGGAMTFGWIFGVSDAKSTNSFMNGDGGQVFISVPTPFRFNGYAAVTHAYGGKTAIELGISSPGALSFGLMPWGRSSKYGE